MVHGSGFWVQDSGFRVQGAGFRVQGVVSVAQDSGFVIRGPGIGGRGKNLVNAYHLVGLLGDLEGARHLGFRVRGLGFGV